MSVQAIQQETMPPATAWIGIDVSKKTLDALLLMAKGHTQAGKFDNTPEGHRKLLKWAKRLAPLSIRHFCMEATGSYSLGIAVELSQAQERVSIVNPYRARRFAQGEGIDIKNDKVDAHVLAKMCYQQSPALWQLPPEHARELVNMSRHLVDLIGVRTQQKNRLSEPGNSKTVINSLTAVIDSINTQIEVVEKTMMDLITQDPDLSSKHDLLTSIPGIGDRTALNLMAELPDIEMFGSASAIIRFAGLDPSQHDSGSSVHKKPKIARKGSRHLRSALYMPTLSAIKCNSVIREFYQRLLARGKPKMTAIVASMRKLLSIAYGVLHSGRSFDASHRCTFIHASDHSEAIVLAR